MRMLSQIIYIISRNWCSCNYSSGNYSICINNLIIWCGILIVDLRKVFAWFITSSIVGTNIYAMETIEHQGIRVNWTVFNVALSSPAGTSDIVMTSIPFPTSAFSCWNAIWLEPISDSESDSCHVMSIWQEWQESQQAASSGAVILPQTFHFSISHIGIEKEILLVSLVSMLITILPKFYHGGNKKQSNWLLPQFCFALALGVSVFNKLYTKITCFEFWWFKAGYSAHGLLETQCVGKEIGRKTGHQTHFYCLWISKSFRWEVLERILIIL